MSDALPLPPHPDLEQYRKLARDLQRACKSGDPAQVGAWAARWSAALVRLQGREITPDVQDEIDRATGRVMNGWRKLQRSNERATGCRLTDAQFFVARAHGFISWPVFVRHLEALEGAGSPIAAFESAADAIAAGDAVTLRRLLIENPDLVRARSTREHHSTLLHYVSANGIEDYRQKTPPNIVEITRLLLDAGADVNAESKAYGGGSTALGLTATSCHPEAAGVQTALMDLLISRGAALDAPDTSTIVNGCLHNGRGEAAAELAGRGARLDLEGAAGVGRLDVVKSYFSGEGSLKPSGTRQQMEYGFAWACEFGRTAVVAFLLDHLPADLRLPHDGQTGLHWAAYGGHADTVRLLLDRGAPVNAKDASFDGTPLEWALYQWGNSPYAAARGSYYEVVAMLVRAGGVRNPGWEDDDRERRRANAKAASDPRMQAALRGEIMP
jgi:hypothetical protein